MRFKELLSLEKVPYLLTILFAMAGWGATHIADQLMSSPIVEYDATTSRRGDTTEVKYVVTNITEKQRFDNLSFLLVAPRQDTFYSGAVVLPPPIVMDNVTAPSEVNPLYFRASLSQLEPGASIELILLKKKGDPIALRLASSSIVRLEPSSWDTFVIKNESDIIYGLVIAWIALIIVYFILLKIFV
ncbi:MAG TPA: hypothetical protein VL547_05160 [Dinghuibacter sp.]|jgi:hypothetical protein|uniref:hypothetical protein n=1 Tax=Dinghuibacter sp. TaxID=2024697 RepID=UPI002D182DA6|nr:hypothetical protein [Dinghuibacter sp.]HTJ11386.1 hypothetical protein [Dinghuibacter sp.]